MRDQKDAVSRAQPSLWKKVVLVYPIRALEQMHHLIGKYQNRSEFPLPSLILLDLKLPGMSGHEFLEWLRTNPDFCTLRTVVLSSSDDMRDVSLAYRLGANSFLIKPADFERFVEISQALNGYWLWLDKSPDGAETTDTEFLSQKQTLP